MSVSSSWGSSGWMASKRWSGISTTRVWPDVAHSSSVFFRSVSSRLSGMVLMAMKLLAFDDQLVADFAADEEDDDLAFLNIIQDPQVPDTQLEARARIGSQALDGLGGYRGLV